MPSGGKRPGAGRKKGSINKVSRGARNKAAKEGLLPHEILLKIARGELLGDHRPSFAERMEAAKAAAPYYAPRLAAIEQKVEGEIIGIPSADPLSEEEWLERFGAESGESD